MLCVRGWRGTVASEIVLCHFAVKGHFSSLSCVQCGVSRCKHIFSLCTGRDNVLSSIPSLACNTRTGENGVRRSAPRMLFCPLAVRRALHT